MPEPFYATVTEFRDYIAPDTTQVSDADITAVIIKSERDLEEYLGGGEPAANGRLFGDPFGVDGSVVNPAGLDAWQTVKLREATCAQTEYRLHWGEEFFSLPSTPVEGEEYSTQTRLPRIAPKAKKHLTAGGLLVWSGRMA
jgi:hypothetical protein